MVVNNGNGYAKPDANVTNGYATVYGADNWPSKYNLNGAPVSSSSANNYWGSPDANIAWLGRRSNGNYCNHMLFALRVYNRKLTADEIAFNHAIDAVRYLGATEAEAFADLTWLPDGYRYNSSQGKLEMRVKVAVSGGGTLYLNGDEANEGWFTLGQQVQLTYAPASGEQVHSWKCLPVTVNPLEPNTVSFTVDASYTGTVRALITSDANFTFSKAFLFEKTKVGNRDVYVFDEEVGSVTFTANRELTVEEYLVVGGGEFVTNRTPALIAADTSFGVTLAPSAEATSLTMGSDTQSAAGGSGVTVTSVVTGARRTFGTAGHGAVVLVVSAGDTTANPMEATLASVWKYARHAVEPSVAVTNNGTWTGLVAGTDYDLTYVGSDSVGPAAAIVKGKGTYSDYTSVCYYDIEATTAMLPDGYTPLSSITAATAGPYIKTGLTVGGTTTVSMDFNTGPNVNDTTFFGGTWTANQFLFIKQNSSYRFYGNGGQVGVWRANTDCHLEITDSNKFILDYGFVAETSTISRSSVSLALFATSAGGNKGCWTLYSMQIRVAGDLKRDYQPAKRNSDGAIGLFDNANNTFYANAGTGAFTPGDELGAFAVSTPDDCYTCDDTPQTPNVIVRDGEEDRTLTRGVHYTVTYTNNVGRGYGEAVVQGLGNYASYRVRRFFRIYGPMPAGFTQLDYVQAASSPYYDLDFKLDNTCVATLDFAVADGSDSTARGLFGARKDSMITNFSAMCQSGKIYMDVNSTFSNSTPYRTEVAYTLKTPYRMTLSAAERSLVKLSNGEDAIRNTNACPDVFVGDRNAYLFDLNGLGKNKAYVWFYGLKVTRGADVLFDAVPAQNPSGDLGLYDFANRRFLKTTNNGALTAGTAKPYPSDFKIDPIPMQRIDRPDALMPAVVVRDPSNDEIISAEDYDVVYSNNTAAGHGLVVVNGKNTRAGQRGVAAFRISDRLFREFRPVFGLDALATGPYIKTRYIHKANTKIDLNINVPSATLSQNTYMAPFGARKNSVSANAYYMVVRFNSSNKPVYCRNAETAGAVDAFPYNEDVAVVCDGKVMTWEGVTKSGSITSSTLAAGANPMMLFCLNSSSSSDYNYSANSTTAMRLYRWRAWEGAYLACDMLPARRLSDGALGVVDLETDLFYANAGSGTFSTRDDLAQLYIAAAIPDQACVGGAPCEPSVVVTDYLTGRVLTNGVHYTISYANNTVPGTGRVILTGIGAYAGIVGGKDYTVTDGGPATPYPNISRAYVPNGLIGFWDAIDNTGTGAHDAAATTWKDLSRYGNDGTLAATAGWANGNAFTNAANGNPCVVPATFGKLLSWYNITWETGFKPTELDATRTVFSTFESANNGMFFAHNNGTTYKDGSMRYYAKNGTATGSDGQIKSYVKANQFAYFTLLNQAGYLSAYRDNNFASTVYGSGFNGGMVSANQLIIGGRNTTPAEGWRGEIRFLRAYNRILPDVERRFNRALDIIRHEKRSLKYVLPDTLPDGYQFDRATDTLSVRIRATAYSASGFIALNGGTPAKEVSGFFPIGTEVTLAYTGNDFVRWDNLTADTLAASQTVKTVTLVAGAPVEARAVATRPALTANSEISAHSYVQKGLLRQFDGIDNAGSGRHNGTVTRWTDLCGSGADWLIRTSYGGFEALGLTLKGSRDAAYMTTPLPTYATAEFTAKATKGYYLFSNADDYQRLFILRPDQGVFGAQRYDGSNACPYGDGGTQLVFGVANTYAAVYRDATKSILDIDYFMNGAAAPYGRSPSSNWSLSSYPALGSRYDADDSHVEGTLYSVRFYDRQLTATELVFNAALDRIRYFGDTAQNVLPHITLPDGYRWNASAGLLEVRVDVASVGGSVNYTSGTWVAAGTPVEITFTPAKALATRWFDLPRNTITSADGKTIAFTAYAPATIRVRAEQELSALTYVADGLIGLWDARENVARDTHNGNSWKWYDLTGCQQEPWTLNRGRADFRDDALCLGGSVGSQQPLYQESLLPDWNTAEAYFEPARTNSAVQLLSNRFNTRLFYIDAKPGVNAFGGYYNSAATVGTRASVVAGLKNTYSIVYAADGSKPQDHYLSGELLPTKTGSYQWNYDTEYPAIGSRYGACEGRALGLLHVLRLYSRPLTATEVAFNAAIDRVRYGGAELKDALPAELPTGWRWNAADELLEVKVTGPDHDAWHAVGETVTLSYAPDSGRAVRAWSGLPFDVTYNADHTTATFAIAAPVTAAVETVPATAAFARSAYLSEGLLASWDGYDASTRAAWGCNGELEFFGNAAAFDGTLYLSNFVAGVKQALMDKALTVQFFLRPKRYIANGGYLHIGTATAYRDLVLNMSAGKAGPAASRRGAFGALQYAANNSQDLAKTGLKEDTSVYFNQDTLVSIVRDNVGARIAFNAADFAFTNSAYSSIPTTDQVNIGTWLGTRNATFDLYAVRIYNRILTADECRYNGALDRARFCGETLVLPEGYTNDEGVVKAEVTLVVPDGSGVISVNGATGVATQSVWLAVGESATFLYTPASGKALEGWTGLPGTAQYGNGRRQVTLKVGGPATYAATGVELTGGDANFDASVTLPAAATVGNGFTYSFANAADGIFALTAKKDMTLEEAIVVGGGGGGGHQNGGGGGGGGVIHITKPVFVRAGESISIQIGAGGAGATSDSVIGGKGDSTFLNGAGIECEAFGGGGGASRGSSAPSSGGKIGSGGGRAVKNTTANTVDWNYDATQGNAGGVALSTDWYAGGGGGATEVGLVGDTTLKINGRGGRGLASAISGALCVYGSGGGAGAGSGTTRNIGGPGAGDGGVNSGAAATAGTDGLGGGGGGGAQTGTKVGGAGGAGGVILRFSDGNTTLTQLVVEVSAPVYLTGASATPEISVLSVSSAHRVSIDPNDYELSWLNNTAPGFAAVIVKGKTGTAIAGLTATATFEIRQPLFTTFAGAGSANGTTWADAYAIQAGLTAAQNAYIQGGFADVLCQAGNYKLTAALTLTQPCAVRGGYAGTDGVSLALDADNPETTFDGQGIAAKASAIAQAITVSSSVAGQWNVLTRCGFGRCLNHGFMKSGSSSLELAQCRIFNNTWGKGQAVTGRGFNISGSSSSTVVQMTDCDVFGNGEVGVTCLDPGNGFGGYFSSLKRVFIDNCHFVTNGWGDNYRSASGAAFYASGAPVTVRNSEFIGHKLSHPAYGGTIYLDGNCGGSAFTNCLFLANAGRHYGAFGNGGNSGVIHCHFDTVERTIDIDHCTFAYNLQGCAYTGMSSFNDHGAAAALDIFQAKAKVRNSIFWGNSISSDDPAGADINVYRGSVDVDYTLFGGLTADYLRANAGATITLGEHVVVGDPQFVSRPEQAKAAFSKYATPRNTGSKTESQYSSRDKVVAFDAHLVSSVDVYSRAIDMSNPAEGVKLEPLPNGAIANLGYYGNTTQAAKTIAGAATLAAADVAVTFPGGVSSPKVSFQLGNTDGLPYNARVTVYIGDGYGWSQDFAGIRSNETITVNCPLSFTPGATLPVKVVVKTPGQSDVVVETSATVAGTVPPWYGHGGDSNKVVHVRAGSTAANPKGTSWTDAYPTLEAANAALTATRNEIWLAGALKVDATPMDFTTVKPATIRGGFTGVEDSLADRTNAVYSTVDGQYKCTPFVAMNAAPITFERVQFTRGMPRAVYHKDSNGGLTFEDCAFMNNGATNGAAIKGAAVCYERSSYTANDHVFTRCRFEGNGRTIANNAQLDGACIFVSAAKSLTVTDCTFFTNGAPFKLVVNGTGSVRPVGTCVYVSGTPTVIEGCHFAGNRACCYKTDNVGGQIYFTGTCNDSVVRNCAFVGNECVTRTNTKNDGGTIGGTIVVNLGEAVRNIYVENCTFAWDFASGRAVPADICAYKGVVNVKNSIFFGGQIGDQSEAGTGRYLNACANGTLNVDYTMFDVATATAVGNYGGGSLNVASTCMTNNPAFVTSNLTLAVYRDVSSNIYSRYSNDVERVAVTGDVHLVSAAGYYDNAGTLHEGGSVLSPAIDAGDPADDYANEPAPNGGFINLGAYGNTAQASRTFVAIPEIVDDDITVTFPDNTSFPQVDFDLAATNVAYTALVKVYCGTNSGEWAMESEPIPLKGGTHFSWLGNTEAFVKGSTLYVKVVVTSGENVIEKTLSTTVTGEMPKWFGKGGGEHVLHVWADAPGAGTGANWKDAFHTFDEAVDAYNENIDEIWVSGNYTLGKTGKFTPSAAFAIRGGFDASENTPSERKQDGSYARLNANNSFNTINVANSAGTPVVLDRLILINSYDRAVSKTGGGDLTVRDCMILTNGIHGTYNDGAGKGIRVTSAAGANIVVTNTLFSGNRLEDASQNQTTGQGSGSGINVTGAASLTVVDCQFYCNGHPLIAPSTSHSGNPRCGGVAGFAIYSEVPTTITYSRFCGNTGICDGEAGATVALRGAAKGSRIANCVFAGNLDMTNGSNGPGTSSITGGIGMKLTDAAGVVDIVNCTFAYNISAAATAAAGVTVKQGVANIRNCVFYGNRLQVQTTDVARDLNVRSTGTCYVWNTLFSADDNTSYNCQDGGTLEFVEGFAFGDPLFASPESSVTNYLKNINAAHIMWDSTKKPDYHLWNLDVHELSCGGYFNNAGEEQDDVEEGIISPAVDAGNWQDDYSREPAYNGKRINAGAYGNTPEASKSATGSPGFTGDVAVEFPNEYTQPQVTFTMGGQGTFLASATIKLIVNENEEEWFYEADTLNGLMKGRQVSLLVPRVILPTDTIRAYVSLMGGTNELPVVKWSLETEVPEDKKLPNWYGHGGDSNKVIHVRADAFGRGDGSDWENAVPSFHSAMLMLTEERNEIWLYLTNLITSASSTYSMPFPYVVRGGFDGHEDKPADRVPGAKSTIDGQHYAQTLAIANPTNAYFERIIFRRGAGCAFRKDASVGDLTMVDCEFRETSRDQYKLAGLGAFDGSSTAKPTLALTNCIFRNVTFSGYGYTYAAAYFRNFRKVYLHGALFTENGTPLNSNSAGAMGVTCFETVGAVLEATECRFVGNNCTAGGGNGCHIRINGGCSGTFFRNCEWLMNLERWVTYDGDGGLSGCVYVNGNFEERPRVGFENCTFAYNLCGNRKSAAGITVWRGDVSVKNCIFYNNQTSKENISGTDIRVHYDSQDPQGARCTVSYSLFNELSTNAYNAAAGGILTVDEATCLAANPLLATSTNEVWSLVNETNPSWPRSTKDRWNIYFKQNATTRAAAQTVSSHLRSRCGYYDETTGELHRFRGQNSPALDKGDPLDAGWRREADTFEGSNGRRINLGRWGGTPNSTMSQIPGSFLRVR